MTETTEAPIMVRVDITRDELKAIKRIALDENKTSQALLGELVRERIAKEVIGGPGDDGDPHGYDPGITPTREYIEKEDS